MENNQERLQIWEDPDLDFDRAKRNGEEWEAAAAQTTREEIAAEYKKAKELFDSIGWPK